jgi:hypothetical protein
LGSSDISSPCNASDRSVGPILAAHPQVRDKPINDFFFLKNIFGSLLQYLHPDADAIPYQPRFETKTKESKP